MTLDDAMLAGAGLVALATARAGRAPGTAPRQRIPSMYADPASWVVLEAVDKVRDDVPTAPETTAMVLVTTHSTIDTMAAVAGAVPGGRLSPLRFAGASAGGPVSLACQVHGLRGPALVITTDPVDGCPAALTMARHWLRTGVASHVVIAVHDHDPVRGHEVRCVVAGPASPGAAR